MPLGLGLVLVQARLEARWRLSPFRPRFAFAVSKFLEATKKV